MAQEEKNSISWEEEFSDNWMIEGDKSLSYYVVKNIIDNIIDSLGSWEEQFSDTWMTNAMDTYNIVTDIVDDIINKVHILY